MIYPGKKRWFNLEDATPAEVYVLGPFRTALEFYPWTIPGSWCLVEYDQDSQPLIHAPAWQHPFALEALLEQLNAELLELAVTAPRA